MFGIIKNNQPVECGGGGSGSSTPVVNALDSNSETDALSAKQGKVLDEKIQALGKITYAAESKSLRIPLNYIQYDEESKSLRISTS